MQVCSRLCYATPFAQQVECILLVPWLLCVASRLSKHASWKKRLISSYLLSFETFEEWYTGTEINSSALQEVGPQLCSKVMAQCRCKNSPSLTLSHICPKVVCLLTMPVNVWGGHFCSLSKLPKASRHVGPQNPIMMGTEKLQHQCQE